ncbi:Peptidase S8/S53 subtilisin/kexin/sedolisin [Penicillium expansum]|nr:Peptidase S8/S53 subtilisin/kexin/sedolisin [Penicillium expansum]
MASEPSLRIVEVAQQCFHSFQLCSQLSTFIPPREFSIWTSNNAVFGPTRVSLDHRLREAPEVAEVVKGLLEALDDHLQSCLSCFNSLVQGSTSTNSTGASASTDSRDRHGMFITSPSTDPSRQSGDGEDLDTVMQKARWEPHILNSNIQAESSEQSNATDNQIAPAMVPLVRTRTRTPCRTCRRRNKKCDETRPICHNCQKDAFLCDGYPAEEIWKSKRQKVNDPVPTSERLEKFLAAASKEIDLLNKLSNTVRKAGRESSNRKAAESYNIQDDEGNDVEPFLQTQFAKYIQDKFPGITAGMRDRLAATILIRRKRILYRRTRYGKTPIKLKPQLDYYPPTIGKPQAYAPQKGNPESSSLSHPQGLAQSVVETTTPSRTRMSATTLTPSQFKRTAVQSVVSESKTVLLEQHEEIMFPPPPVGNFNRRYKEIQASYNEDYKRFLLQLSERLHTLGTPRPIEASLAYQVEIKSAQAKLKKAVAMDWENLLRSMPEVTCPYCFHAFPANEMANIEKWHSHVKKDLDPYVCLFEECETPEELFSHSNDWLEHMRGHNLRWQCNSKSHGVQRFTSRDAYLAHIKEIHPSSCTRSQLDILADRSTRKISRVFNSCPLCGKVDVNYDSLVAHVVGHLRLLAVKSLPPYEHEDDVYQPSDTDDASRGKSIPASEGERGGSDQMSIDTTILGSQGQDSQLNYDMNNSTFFVDESEFDGIPEHDRWKFEWGPILNFVQPDPLAFDPVIRNMTALASVRDRDNDPERRPADSSWYNPNHIAIQDMDPSSRWVDCMIKISSILSDTLENENSIMDLAHFRVAVLGDDYDWGSDVQFFGDKILHQRNFRTRDPSLKPMTFSNRGRITQAISMMCPQAGFLLAGLDSHYSASRGIILCTAKSVSRAVRWATSHRASIICLPEAIERPELKKEATDLNNAVDEALDAGILIFSSTRNLREWDNRIYAVSAHHSECFRIGAVEDFSTTQPGLYFDNVDFLFPGYFLMQTDSADLGIKDLSFFERSGPSVATAFATGLAALILSCGPLFNSESSEGKWPQWATGDLPHQDMKDVFRAIGTGVESVHKFVEVWNFFDDVIAECEQAPSDQRTKILAQIPERLEARRLAFSFQTIWTNLKVISHTIRYRPNLLASFRHPIILAVLGVLDR